MWQPFAALIVFTFLFGALYLYWAADMQNAAVHIQLGAPVHNNVGEALLFSANNVFRPFNAWSDGGAEASVWLKDFLSGATGKPKEVHGAGVRLAIRLVATFQSLLALLLAFLFALAVRRRFQIS